MKADPELIAPEEFDECAQFLIVWALSVSVVVTTCFFFWRLSI